MTMQFPAGKYWIGDPCYVLGANGFSWTHSTAYGDGLYKDKLGRVYLVDSGTLGIFYADAIPDADVEGGNFVTQRKPFTPTYEGGKFTFGTVVIDTEI
jgi:hypothetical protein